MAVDLSSYKVAASELSSSTKFDNLVQAVQDALNSLPASQITGYPSSATKFLRGDGSWAAPTGQLPIDLRNPRSTSLAGNSFFTVVGLTDWDLGHWEFVKDVDGKVYGGVKLGGNETTIRLALLANATTGVTRMSVRHKIFADGASANPGSLTAITSQDVTVPATAYLRKDITFTISESVVAGSFMIVEVFHEGAHANDTLAVNTLLLGAWVE